MFKRKPTGRELVNKLRKSKKYLIRHDEFNDAEIHTYEVNGKEYRVIDYNPIYGDYYDPDYEALHIDDVDCGKTYRLDDVIETFGKQCSVKRR